VLLDYRAAVFGFPHSAFCWRRHRRVALCALFAVYIGLAMSNKPGYAGGVKSDRLWTSASSPSKGRTGSQKIMGGAAAPAPPGKMNASSLCQKYSIRHLTIRVYVSYWHYIFHGDRFNTSSLLQVLADFCSLPVECLSPINRMI
jgi:hypothetical protein